MPLRGARFGGRWSYAALGVVIVVALVIGSRHNGPLTDQQRITHLESIIKCPDCADLTIGQSTTALADGLRTDVIDQVRAGRTDAEIEQYVVAKDGPGEILAPRGGSGWVAVGVPIGAFVIALGVIAFTLARRRRAGDGYDGGPSDEDLALVAAALSDRRTGP